MLDVEYDKFELPVAIMRHSGEHNSTYGRFEAAPFSKGMGHTIGNTLRRLLMIGLQSPGIISIAIDGVEHEYLKIAGVIEDMPNLILNLKGARLRNMKMKPGVQVLVTTELDITQADLDRSGGFVEVTIGDLITKSQFEVVSPSHKVFTVTAPLKRSVQLRVAYGRGYVPSERHELSKPLVNEIAIDTSFSPVKLVNYTVEDFRVGQDTDMDKLVFTITTDGRITPEEAVSLSAQIAGTHFSIFDSGVTKIIPMEDGEENKNDAYERLVALVATPLDNLELSVRSTNCLRSKEIKHIYHLILYAEKELLQFDHLGKKSKEEIDDILKERGLSLSFCDYKNPEGLIRYTTAGVTAEKFKDFAEKFALDVDAYIKSHSDKSAPASEL